MRKGLILMSMLAMLVPLLSKGGMADTTWKPIIVIFQNEYGQNASKWVKGSDPVNPGEESLIILLGDDKEFPPSQLSVVLDGSSSYSPNGSIVSWQWSQVSGEGIIAFSDPTSSITTASGMLPGREYVFKLEAEDDKGNTGEGAVKVKLNALDEDEFFIADSALFNFTPVAQSVNGWTDVVGEPTLNVLSATASNGWTISTVGTDTVYWRGDPAHDDSSALSTGMTEELPHDPFGFYFPPEVTKTGFHNCYSEYVGGKYNLEIGGLDNEKQYQIQILGSFYDTDNSTADHNLVATLKNNDDEQNMATTMYNTSRYIVFDTVKPDLQGNIQINVAGIDSMLQDLEFVKTYSNPTVSGMKIYEISKGTPTGSITVLHQTYFYDTLMLWNNREYAPVIVYAPYKYDPQKSYPMLFYMGGHESKAINGKYDRQFITNYGMSFVSEKLKGKVYGLDSQGDTVGFVIVQPQLNWNDYRDNGGHVSYQPDQIDTVIKQLKDRLPFDINDDLYIAGFSAGADAMMNYLLNRPRTVKAGFIQSGFFTYTGGVMKDSLGVFESNGGRLFATRRVDGTDPLVDSIKSGLTPSARGERYWNKTHTGFSWEYVPSNRDLDPFYRASMLDFFADPTILDTPKVAKFSFAIGNPGNVPDGWTDVVGNPTYRNPSQDVITVTDINTGWTISTVSTSLWGWGGAFAGINYSQSLTTSSIFSFPYYVSNNYMMGTGGRYHNNKDLNYADHGGNFELSGLEPNTDYEIWVVANGPEDNKTLWSTDKENMVYDNGISWKGQNWKKFEGTSDGSGNLSIGFYRYSENDVAVVNAMMVIEK